APAEQCATGVQLHHDTDLTTPAVLEVITPTQGRRTLSEGRYHPVKRMFAAVGPHGGELHRERRGGLTLDAEVAPGDYRPLTDED
ncbi:16S rRNA pseudouridine(516) synthase, partial [Escherichia coli]|nr:16S rRNA pseudouridine(516) synthase [Escherichia coli]